MNNTPYVTSSLLKNIQGLRHGFATKFASPPDLKLSCYLDQVHEAEIMTVNESSLGLQGAGDGLGCEHKNKRLLIKTADCIPVFICDVRSTRVMALHCGWRPIQKGIVHKAIAWYRERGVAANDLKLALGPCISQKAYEVGKDFLESISQTQYSSVDTKAFIKAGKKQNKFYYDLPGFLKAIFIEEGVLENNIDLINHCTYSEKNEFYSHRREPEEKRRLYNFIELV